MGFHERFIGIYSRAAFLGTTLPIKCEDEEGFSCGRVNIRLSKNLLTLFMIKENKKALRDLDISFKKGLDKDGQEQGATVIVAVEGRRAAFFVTSLRIDNNGSVDAIRDLFLKRELGHGMILSEYVNPGSKEFEAFNQIMDLAYKRKLPMEPGLLCGACPAQINGLPRTEV